MTEYLPLTPGLLISMAIRYDHSFGIWMGSFETQSTLEEKQRSILDEVISCYSRRQEITNSASGTDAQLREEMTGQGFYRPEREAEYISGVSRAVADHAAELIEGVSDE